MTAIEPNISALLLFAASWLLFCSGALLIAGMLPLSEAPVEVRTPSGLALLFLNGVLLLALLATMAVVGFHELRWTSVVITGGLLFLLAPFMIQDMPEAIKNGRRGLFLLLGALAAMVSLSAPFAMRLLLTN